MSWIASRIFSGASLFLGATAFGLAGAGTWSTSGPEEATVLSLDVDSGDPARVYVGTDAGGVFVSSDSGVHWTFAGLGGQRILGLVVDPSNTSRLYARTWSRLYRSLDRGGSWTDISAGLPLVSSSPYTNVNLSTLGVDAAGAVYAGISTYTLNVSHSFLSGALYKSSNQGDTWAMTGLSGPGPGPMAVDSLTLYVGVTAGGLLPEPSSIRKSVDGGLTWTTVRDNLPLFATVSATAADAAARGRILVAYSNPGAPPFIELTDDGGSTWLPLASPPSGAPTALGLGNGRLYLASTAALYGSSDEGSTWSGLLNGGFAAIAVARARPEDVYAGGDGVAASQDAGDTWSSSLEGLTNSSVSSLALDPRSPGGLYAGSASRIFHREAEHSIWAPIGSLPTNLFGGSLAIDPNDSSTWLIGVMTVGLCQGVLRSNDGGASWTPTDLTTGCIGSIMFDPRHDEVVFARGQFGLWKSVDGGLHWGSEVLAAFQGLAFDPSRTDVVFGATNQSVMRSDDGGVTWVASDAGIPLSRYGCASDGTDCPKRTAWAIAVDPRDGSRLYASVPDQGPFSLFGAPPPPVDSGFFRSVDGGATWEVVGSGLPDTSLGYFVLSIAVDPAGSNHLFVSSYQGIFESSDGGLSFGPFNEGLVNTSVLSLLFDASGLALHAATQGNGVFDIDIPRSRPAVEPVPRRRPTHVPSRP
jgi:hypothetical protein